jgi:hypothetical protein
MGEDFSVRLYPLPICHDLEIDSAEAIMEDGVLLRPLLEAAHSDSYFMAGNHGLVAEGIGQYRRTKWTYRQAEMAQLFWVCLDLDDAVIVRGLHALLKSEMLFEHFQFRDASLAMAHIALDGAYSAVLRRLRRDGFSNPTVLDAQAYLDDAFGVPRSGLPFFDGYYDDRVRNFHTDSRHGAEAIPFFCIDDIWDLNRALMAYRSFWRFWQARSPATIRRPLSPHHPVSAIARHQRVACPLKSVPP